ncbi:hypothetical protein RJ640_013356 [Escallonia rubra]|uniref:DCD domain-containing protein n=1 Tax=Escallonia rubra TaxID=112253 RepID=A0AA88QW87_9ASTE|nr:hypothetical protein RJ640_013356 [Escallonia rubra]
MKANRDMAGGKEEAVKVAAPSGNSTGKALLPKAKIAKKSMHKSVMKISKLGETSEVQGGKKKKNASEADKERSNNVNKNEKKPNLSEIKQRSIVLEKQNDKSNNVRKTKEKLSSLQKKQQNQKNHKKHSGLEKQQRQMKIEKRAELERNFSRQKKKEELGGLIFMCNAKTKADCYRYGVMGVPLSKKDLVLGVKPGLKVFLYDFDLRLMYGIYKTSSSGGMKLEPTAFNGAFPVQVRFTVYEDCYPLPESTFSKAIKENYDERNKFDTELSLKQVRKLMELFQPVEVVSNSPVIGGARESWHRAHNTPYARDHYKYDDRRLPYRDVPSIKKEEFRRDTFLSEKEYRTYGLRGERPNLAPPESRVSHALEPYRRVNASEHLRQPSPVYVLHREDYQHLPYREVPPTEREVFRRDSFLSEKEYRIYGLRREKPNLTPPRSDITPALEPDQRFHVSERHRQPAVIYRERTTPGEPIRHDPLFLTEKEYQTYGIRARRELQQSSPVTATATASNSYSKHPYSTSHYGASSVEPYPPLTRRDEIPSGYTHGGSREATEHLSRRGGFLRESGALKRREDQDVERSYSTHASSALSEYNRGRNYEVGRHEPALAPVSSRSIISLIQLCILNFFPALRLSDMNGLARLDPGMNLAHELYHMPFDSHPPSNEILFQLMYKGGKYTICRQITREKSCRTAQNRWASSSEMPDVGTWDVTQQRQYVDAMSG